MAGEEALARPGSLAPGPLLKFDHDPDELPDGEFQLHDG